MSGIFQGNGGFLGTGEIIRNIYPNPPTDLSASSILSYSAVINFTKQATPTNGYYVYNNGVQIASFVGDASSITLSGLTALSSYVITIASYNKDGISEQSSSSISFSTLTNTPKYPTLSITNITYNNATIRIAAPTYSAIPTSYYYYSTPGISGYSSDTSYGIIPYGGATTVFNFAGLTPMTSYTFYIASNNNGVLSTYTSSNFLTLNTVPNPPAKYPFYSVSITTGNVFIYAPSTGSTPTSYYYYAIPGISGYSSDTSYGTIAYSGATTNLVLSGLTQNTAYILYIASNNTGGTSSYVSTSFTSLQSNTKLSMTTAVPYDTSFVSGTYTGYVFTQTKTYSSFSYTSPISTNMYAMVVAGGGSGGSLIGGAGGGGGVAMTSISVPVGSDSMAITVGAGGVYLTANRYGVNGSNTNITFTTNTANNIVVVGGGGGGGWSGTSAQGFNGGSGGGNCGHGQTSVQTSPLISASTGSNYPRSIYYGCSGGITIPIDGTGFGAGGTGGGGAGQVGETPTNTTLGLGGKGGNGISWSSTSYYTSNGISLGPYNTNLYGSGGGGANNYFRSDISAGGPGGITGGGAGSFTSTLINATANTGGGGGGGTLSINGGNGGSGVVILLVNQSSQILTYPPSNVSVGTFGVTTATISIAAPSYGDLPTSYYYYATPAINGYSSPVVYGVITGPSGYITNFNLSGLTTNTMYTFYVASKNSSGTSSYISTTFYTVISAPNPPSSLYASLNSSTSANMYITSASGPLTTSFYYYASPGISGYNSSTSYGVITPSGSTTMVAFTGLATNTLYYLYVAANNSIGTSNYNYFYFRTSAVLGSTSQIPSNFTYSSITSTTAVFSISAPSTGTVPTSYYYYASPGISGYVGDTSYGTVAYAGTTTNVSLLSLTPNTVYTLYVASNNTTGRSNFTTSTMTTLNTTPLSVSSLSSSSITPYSATIAINAPASGSIPVYYYYYGSPGISGYTSSATYGTITYTGSNTNLYLNGLSLYTNYTVYIASNNNGGTSTYTSNAFQTLNILPNQPATLSTSAITASTATMTITIPAAGGGTVFYYYYYATPGISGYDSPSSYGSITYTGSTINYPLAGLTSNTAYTLYVATNNNIGTSSYVSTTMTTLNTTPLAVSALSSSSITSTSARIVIAAPATGSIPAYYYYYTSPGVSGYTSSAAYGTVVYTGSNTNLYLNGLSLYTNYTIYIASSNNGGTSSYTSTTLSTLNTLPNQPSSLSSSSITPSTATMMISLPSGGGGIVSSYYYYSSPGISGYDSSSNYGVIAYTGSAINFGLVGLTPNTAYTFYVATNNNIGTSTYITTTFTTLNTTPLAVSSLSSTSITSSSSTIVIAAPASGSIPAYYYYYTSPGVSGYTSSAAYGTIAYTGSNTNLYLNGLSLYTNYTIYIASNNNGGTSIYTSKSFQTLNILPNQPSSLSTSAITASGATISISIPNAGGLVSSYYYYAVPGISGYNSSSNYGVITYTGSTINFGLVGLTPNTAYTFYIASNNNIGTSSYTNTIFTTLNTTPLVVSSLSSSSITSSSATIAIAAPASGSIPAYYYYYTSPGVSGYTSSSAYGTVVYSGSNTNLYLNGLSVYTNYTVYIASNNNGGTSSYTSNTFNTLNIAPNQPSSLSISAITTTTATLTISIPSGGGLPSFYYYYASPGISGYNSPSSYGTITYTGSTIIYPLAGLTIGTAYTLYVASNNTFSTSSYNSVSFNTSSGTIAGNYYTWGYNSAGYCGNGTTSTIYMPTLITNNAINGSPMNKLIKTTAVQGRAGGATSGSSLTYAIDVCNNVFGWGNGASNFFGPTLGTSSIPQNITSIFGGATIVQIGSNSSACYAIDSNGILYGWGSPASYSPYLTNTPMSLHNTSYNGVTTSISGRSIASFTVNSLLFVLVIDTLGDLHYMCPGNSFAVIPSNNTSYAIPLADYTGGNGTYYRNLFYNVSQSQYSGSLYRKKIVSVGHTQNNDNVCYVIDINGQVHTWGNNFYGDGTVGSVYSTPKNISTISNIGSSIYGLKIVKMISTYGTSNAYLMLDSSGSLHVFGIAGNYLGINSTTTNAYTPINIMNIAGSSLNGKVITDIGRIERSFVALDTNGQVHEWGNGIFGNNNTSQAFNTLTSLLPVNISLTPGSPLNGAVVKLLGDIGVII
jgi:hypothetical protein